MPETRYSCCSQMVRETATSSKPLASSQVTVLSSLSGTRAWLTVESACCTSAGATSKLGSLTTKEPMIQQAASPRCQPDHIEGAVAWHQLLLQVTHLHQIRHLFGIGFAQVRAISDQPQFVFWCLLHLFHRHFPQALRQMLRLHLRALGTRSGRQTNHPLRSFFPFAQLCRLGRNLLANQTT